MSGFNELVSQFVQRSLVVHGFHLGAGDNAVAYFYAAEVQCILEYLYLVFYLLFILNVVYIALYQMVQVYFSENLLVVLFFDLHAKHEENTLA